MNGTIFDVTAVLLEEKLRFVTIKPNKIAIVGSDYGSTTGILNKLYTSELTEMDTNSDKYQPTRNKISWLHKHYKKNCHFRLFNIHDTDHVNDCKNQYNFVISNLYLPRVENNLSKLFTLWRDLLRPSGLLFFTFLGLDSFIEIYRLFNRELIRNMPLYHRDMHDIGDQLMQFGFVEPVMSMDLFTLQYKQPETLLKDLQELDILPMMLSWLNVSHQNFVNVLKNKMHQGMIFQVSYEFIFAHAVRKNTHHPNDQQEQKINFYSG